MDHLDYQARLRAAITHRESGFPEAEFHQRWQALDRQLEDAGLDALLVTQPADIHYLTGYNTFEVSVHAALAYCPGRLVLQVASIETGPAIATALCDEVLGYRWESTDEIIEPLARTLIGMGRRIGYSGWSPGLRPGVLDALRRHLSAHSLQEADGLLAGLRRVKSAAEIDCLVRSARMTEAGIEAAAEAAITGATDSDMAAAAAGALHAAGSEFMSMQPIIVAGQRSSIIHTNHHRHALTPGESVFIELGGVCERYTAPLMHTVMVDHVRADDHRRRVAGYCRAVYQALIDAMRPGQSFDQAAREAEAALAPIAGEAFFSGVFGYTVGATFPPSWVEGSGFIARQQFTPFEENMVFHLPLCFRLPGRWGIGFSETVRVTATGAEPLTRNDWSFART